MKVPTLQLYSTFVIIDNNGAIREKHDRIIQGCWQMCQYLQKNYGIKTSPSTVWGGKKKLMPSTFPGGKSKEYYLAYFNWALNYPRSKRTEFFENEIDSKYYYKNPFTDFYIVVKKKVA